MNRNEMSKVYRVTIVIVVINSGKHMYISHVHSHISVLPSKVVVKAKKHKQYKGTEENRIGTRNDSHRIAQTE